MITIYGQLRSRAARCLWALEEMGMPYRHVSINPAAGETKTPEFLAINPLGKIPALTDGDLNIGESMAITLYLARKYGKALWPLGEADQARVLQWTFWGITAVEPELMTILAQNLFVPADKKRPDRVEDARNALVAPLNVLNAHLKNRPYILGPQFTIADLNVAGILSLASVIQFDLSPYPNVTKWLDSCLGRPAYQKVMRPLAEGQH
jgi:glutathione S-transferase